MTTIRVVPVSEKGRRYFMRHDPQCYSSAKRPYCTVGYMGLSVDIDTKVDGMPAIPAGQLVSEVDYYISGDRS